MAYVIHTCDQNRELSGPFKQVYTKGDGSWWLDLATWDDRLDCVINYCPFCGQDLSLVGTFGSKKEGR